MEEEKLEKAKAILLENDGNKFASIKAFMAQYETDIDTAASYVNKAYKYLDAPNTTVAICQPEPTVIKEFEVIEAKPQAAPKKTLRLIPYSLS